MSSTPLADRLEAVAAELRTYPTATDALRLLQGLTNAIDAEKVDLVAEVAEREGHKGEGCSSVKNWLRDQLHLDTGDAAQLVRSAKVLRDMPGLAGLAAAGAVSLDHVDAFGYAARRIDPMVVEASMDWMLLLAERAEPQQIRSAVKKLRDAAHPDDLDEAWIKGMSKHDIKINRVLDGFHLAGFLPADIGANFRTVLQSLSAPTCAEDDRPINVRRITALDQLLSSVLESGLPQDKGVRPHVDLTPILTAGKHSTLDVGRTHRLATPSQRKAVVNRQQGRCAGHGCYGPVVHVHHIQYWSEGGTTDLANLIGLCPRCHALVHQRYVTIDPVTHEVHRTLRTRRTSPRRTRAG